MSDFQYTQPELVKLNDMIEEAVDSLIREDSEKQFRKDVAERAKEELKLKSSQFNALVKERFNQTATKTYEKNESIIEFNEELLTAARNAKGQRPEE